MITTRKIDPRPYQQKAAAAIHREWDAGNKKTLVVMPTGTGKTIVFASIVNDQVAKGEHVLILAHREEHLQQASDKLKMVTGLETALEKAQSSALDSDKMVVVASVQTLSKQNRLMKYPRDYFGTIIIDEAHHTAAKTYKGILEHFIDAKVLGVTATPDRSDMKSLSDIFDSLAFEYKLPDAIREGYLCKINTKTIPVEVDISKVHINAGDFSAQDLGNVLDLYLDTIADAIVRECQNRKTVIFTPLVRISKRLCNILNKRNFKTAEVNGASADRKDVLKGFDNGEYKALTNAMLLTEGWDCPTVDCIICLRPTKSRSLYAQIVGRGTRLCEGKKNLLVLDFLWLTKKHSLCHPADIFCEDPEVAQKTTDMLADAALTGSNSQENFGSPELGLIEAIEEAQTELDEEKRKALCELEKQDTIQRKLKAQRQKPRGLVDPLQYIFSIEAPELNDYQPMFESERQEPSDDIIDSISCYGVKGDAIKSQGLAAAILKRLIARRASGMATPKQIRCLESFGFVHVGRWTLRYASSFLDIISSHDWKLPNGFDASTLDPEKNTAEDLAKLYPDYKEDETKKAPRGDAFICCYYDASYNLARKKVCNSEKEMLNLYYSLFNTCEAKYFYYTKEADAWMAEKQNLIARKTGTPIPAAQPTQATPAVPPPFVPTAPAKSHEYYCCLARWDGSYIGYETYKSEQAAQNARKQIARRGETAVFAHMESAQRKIDPNNQTTYAKRFFERVMMNPAKTMPELHKSFLLLKNKAKANGMRGLYNSSDKKIMALIDMLDGNYPDHLSEKQKGEYLVGYYQQRSANIKDAEEKKNRKAAKIETNNTDTATTVATQKEK